MIKKLHMFTVSFCVFLSLGITSTSLNALEIPHETKQAKSMVIEESNFQQLSQEMEKRSLGLVLMFHAEHCPYCALMEREILNPMVKSGEYVDKVMIRKLQMDESRDIKDWTGNIAQPSNIAALYDISVTPTLVFLDSKGKQRAKKMVGINTVDYFGVYLDEEIETLRKNIK